MARRRKLVDPEDVFVDALERARPEFLDCRGTSHSWRVTTQFHLVDTDVEDRQPRGGYRSFAERKLTCQRCGMVRSDAFSIARSLSGHTALHKISSQYEAPEGYSITGIGNTQGMRDLLYGVAFDASMANGNRRKR